jgi:hypothetical protein
MNRIVRDAADGAYSYDVHEYHVEQRFEYPRFLCYECHSFVRFPAWNPYLQQCTRYRIVRYDSPAYHSVSGYSPTRVVFSRPRQIEPQFIFAERASEQPFITVEAERPERVHPGSAQTGGATASEVGGVGTVPAPLGRRGTVSVNDLRRLTRADSTVRADPMSRIRSASSAVRPQPRLLRRKKVKPDTSGARDNDSSYRPPQRPRRNLSIIQG